MEEEKEFYKKMIIEMINGIDKIEVLVYLNRLIGNMLKRVG